MTIRFGPNPVNGIYFGPQDATAAVALDVDDLTSAAALEAPLIAEALVADSLASSAELSDAQVAAAHTINADDLASSTILLSTTIAAEGQISADPLVSGGQLETPSAFASEYQYVLIGTREPSLPPGEALFDDDVAAQPWTGDVYVYGVGKPNTDPADWDYSGLANWYINAAPNGGTFTYRLWDVDLGQWSNEAVETFSITVEAISGDSLTSTSLLSTPALELPGIVDADDLGSSASLGEPAITSASLLNGDALTSGAQLDAATVVLTFNLATDDLLSGADLEAPSIQVGTGLNADPLLSDVILSPAVLNQVGVLTVQPLITSTTLDNGLLIIATGVITPGRGFASALPARHLESRQPRALRMEPI